MKRKTKTQREAERMAFLRKIRDGEKVTHANRVIAPLGQAALVEVEWAPGWRVKSLKLSAWGETVLKDWESRHGAA